MTLMDLHCATVDANNRVGGELIGTSVKKGRFRVERVRYEKNGKGIITPLSGWLTMSEAVGFLDAMTND